jgi:DNA-binding transcriptional regulator GbsR (MarR family)
LGRALNAEETALTLSVTRANIRISVKESQGRALVKATHLMGNRRDRTDRHVRSSHERR